MYLSFCIGIKTKKGCSVHIVRLAPNKKAQDLGAEDNLLIMQLIKERLEGSSAGEGFGDAVPYVIDSIVLM